MVAPPVWYVMTWLGLSCLYFAFWSDLYHKPTWVVVAYLVVGIALLTAVCWNQLR